jgi:hypothetical protein
MFLNFCKNNFFYDISKKYFVIFKNNFQVNKNKKTIKNQFLGIYFISLTPISTDNFRANTNK